MTESLEFLSEKPDCHPAAKQVLDRPNKVSKTASNGCFGLRWDHLRQERASSSNVYRMLFVGLFKSNDNCAAMSQDPHSVF
jgi:hypothetical protein